MCNYDIFFFQWLYHKTNNEWCYAFSQQHFEPSTEMKAYASNLRSTHSLTRWITDSLTHSLTCSHNVFVSHLNLVPGCMFFFIKALKLCGWNTFVSFLKALLTIVKWTKRFQVINKLFSFNTSFLHDFSFKEALFLTLKRKTRFFCYLNTKYEYKNLSPYYLRSDALEKK